MEFKIACKGGARTIEGKVIKLVPWLKTTIHKSINGWRISEYTTGTAFIPYQFTREEAKTMALERANRIGREKILSLLKSFEQINF